MKEIQYHEQSLRTISNYVRQYRIISGLTQEKLSEFTGLSRNTIIRAESNQNISLNTLLIIAQGLGMNIQEAFITEDD